MNDKSTKIVVTGMGVINAVGNNVEEFSEALRCGKSGIGNMTKFDKCDVPVGIGAELSGFDFLDCLKKFNLSPKLLNYARKSGRNAPFPVQAAVISAFEAWQNAKLDEGNIDSGSVGIVVAGQNIAQNYLFNMNKAYHSDVEKLHPSYALHFMDTDHVGVLSDIFTIYGEGFTVGGASASGNVGIIQGMRLIRAGVVDVCFVVGGLADFSPVEMSGFYIIGAMGGRKFLNEPAKACRPFDQEHEGFIYGQGSACLILESEESANNRKVPALAEIAGGVIVLDGNRQPSPSAAGEKRAMENALKQANLKKSDVQYLNAHGSSSVVGDDAEIKAIKSVFNESISDLWINSTKSITGHCLWSAGVTEAIGTIIQMREGFVHPNLNLDNPIDKSCRFAGRECEEAVIDVALSNSFGFGGINTSVVIKR